MDLKLRNNSQLALSSGYIPVEYVESTGYPNINTGITSSYNPFAIKVEAVIEVISSGDTASYIYIANFSSGPYFDLVLIANSSSSFKASCSRLSSVVPNALEIEFTGKSHIIAAKGYITVNGTTYTHTGSNRAVTSSSLRLLQSGNATIRSYSYKVYKSNILVRDYIPVISYQEGHWGEACLYDKVNGVFYYSDSTGNFTASINIYAKMITAYVKDCPNISGIDLLRRAVNLQRIRCDVGNVSGSVTELLRYTALAGFTDDYQEQQIPRIIGTWTLNDWYTNEELENFQGAIDGLTVLGDSTHNIETALENGDFAVQTIDSTKPNYNPAVAIKLNANGYGNIFTIPLIEGEGRWFLTKDEAASISDYSIFTQFTTVVDEDGIVTNNDEEEYTFDSFDEFKYFNGVTTLGGAVTSPTGFSGCTNLERVVIPNSITRLGGGRNNSNGAFGGCSSLERINFPSSITTSGATTQYISVFTGCTSLSRVDIDDLSSYLSVTFYGTSSAPFYASSAAQRGLYLNGVLLTDIVIPDSVTTINKYTFYGMSAINTIELNNVTTIDSSAFAYCSGLTSLTIPSSVSSLGIDNFNGCTSLQNLLILTNITIGSAGTRLTDSGYYLGNNTGTCFIKGTYYNSSSPGLVYYSFKSWIICGDFKQGSFTNYSILIKPEILRVGGSASWGNNYSLVGNQGSNTFKFTEVMGTITTTGSNSWINIGSIVHLGYTIGVATTPSRINATGSAVSKVYVGNGSSRANDEAVLALYLADTNWSAQSAKLGTWYDYNGEYKWYYVTDNLTNCTNTNPDEWPHITRGESYETTIVPDEGMTINSLTVEMLDTDTTSPTYDTYIPQPTSYDSATGIYTISIPSVTGNVVITASAS